MRRWSKETFGDIFDQIKKLEENAQLMETQFEINLTEKSREELSHAEAEIKRYRSWEEDF